MTESIFFIPQYKLYCERIINEGVKSKGIIVMLHGGGHTGVCYKITPDGRPGWAYNFAEAGYEVYVVDWPGIGRSGYVNYEELNGTFVVDAIIALLKKITSHKSNNSKVILFTHSMSGPYGWMLLEKAGEYIQQIIAVSPGMPGNIQSVPQILSQTDKSVEAMLGSIKYNLSFTEAFVCTKEYARIKFIGDSKLFPDEYFDDYFASIIPMPPRLIHDRLNINSTQLKISESFVSNGETKVTIIVGTNDTDHPRELDMKIHDYLLGLGVNSEFIWLGDYGIEGNGHMMMLESNSEVIAKFIMDRIGKEF